jgi:hypothetical protein
MHNSLTWLTRHTKTTRISTATGVPQLLLLLQSAEIAETAAATNIGCA